MMRCCLAGFVAVLLVCCPLVLLAQTPQEKALAQKRYKVGEQLYEISQYDKALIEFKEAYRLYPLPGMLFNIARCHEVLANLGQAIASYKLFLAKRPDSPRASVVQNRIKALEQRLAREKAARATPPSPPVKPAVVKDRPAPAFTPSVEDAAPAGPGRTWRWTAGWTGVGVGGAALVTGVAFGALAAGKSSEHDDLEASGGVYEDLQRVKESGQQYETLQIALMAVGGVVVAAGGGLLIWELLGQEKQSPGTQAMIAPVVTQDSVGFVGSLSF